MEHGPWTMFQEFRNWTIPESSNFKMVFMRLYVVLNF
jgi:hypothetical protein